MIAYGIPGGATVATVISTAISVSAFRGGYAAEAGMQALEEVLEGMNGGRYERIGQVTLRPRDEECLKNEGIGRIASFVKGFQSACNEYDITAGSSAVV
jgi:hypothetical protein